MFRHLDWKESILIGFFKKKNRRTRHSVSLKFEDQERLKGEKRRICYISNLTKKLLRLGSSKKGLTYKCFYVFHNIGNLKVKAITTQGVFFKGITTRD